MPPTVNKVKPPIQTAIQAPPGSLLAKGISSGARLAELRKYKIAVYGQNRTGKTAFACEFEPPVALVMFDPLEAADTVRDKIDSGRVVVYPQTSTPGAVELAEEIRKVNPFKTVVFDGGTSCQDMVLQELEGWDSSSARMLGWGTVGEDTYRVRSEKTREVIRKFLSLDCNVIVLCQEKDHSKPPTNEKGKPVRRSKLLVTPSPESFFASSLGQATVEWLHNQCSFICRLYVARETRTERQSVFENGAMTEVDVLVETGETVRRLLLQPQVNYAAGPRVPMSLNLPEYVEGKSPKQLYDRFMATLRGDNK